MNFSCFVRDIKVQDLRLCNEYEPWEQERKVKSQGLLINVLLLHYSLDHCRQEYTVMKNKQEIWVQTRWVYKKSVKISQTVKMVSCLSSLLCLSLNSLYFSLIAFLMRISFLLLFFFFFRASHRLIPTGSKSLLLTPTSTTKKKSENKKTTTISFMNLYILCQRHDDDDQKKKRRRYFLSFPGHFFFLILLYFFISYVSHHFVHPIPSQSHSLTKKKESKKLGNKQESERNAQREWERVQWSQRIKGKRTKSKAQQENNEEATKTILWQPLHH